VQILQPPAHAGSLFVDFSTLKMEVIHSFTQDLHGATSQKTAFFSFYLDSQQHMPLSHTSAWSTVMCCPRLKLSFCLVPWLYTPTSVPLCVLQPSV
jgi:hypothetical protein